MDKHLQEILNKYAKRIEKSIKDGEAELAKKGIKGLPTLDQILEEINKNFPPKGPKQ